MAASLLVSTAAWVRWMVMPLRELRSMNWFVLAVLLLEMFAKLQQ